MSASRLHVLIAILKGLLAAIAFTLVCMTGVAALAVLTRVSDGLIVAANQIMKLAAVVLGVAVSVGRGGERGFFTGMTLAMLYMALGYALYVLLGGSAFEVTDMLGEILIGAAVGGIAGAVFSNLPTRRRKPA